MLATAQVRLAFFRGDTDPKVIMRARELALAAVAAAPQEVMAHLALGHVELNLGEPGIAAGHFRVAIACAPHSADAHEQLGRMLLEAGYVDQGVTRLQEAIAINPLIRSAMWEIARAWALEGKWEDHDTIVAEMVAVGFDRVVPRARYAWWRRDIPRLAALRAELDTMHAFAPGLIDQLYDVFVHGAWATRREGLVRLAYELPPVRRRRAFVGQLVAEAAAYSNDVEAALAIIEYAITEGLFDLHWLDRCPLLDNVRADPALRPLRARIKARADGILDALYGDHHIGTSETAVASG
jgi:serine/threonine-protein kinase